MYLDLLNVLRSAYLTIFSGEVVKHVVGALTVEVQYASSNINAMLIMSYNLNA